MPYRVRSALNVNGTIPVMSDEEKVNVDQANRTRDELVRQRMLDLQGQQIANQDRQFYAGLGAQRDITGTFKDRSAADMSLEGVRQKGNLDLEGVRGKNQLGVVGAQMAPAMIDADLRKRQYDDQGYMRDLEKSRAGVSQMLLDQARNEFASPTSAGREESPQDRYDRLAVLAALANGGQVPDFAERDARKSQLALQTQEMEREAAKRRQNEAAAGGMGVGVAESPIEEFIASNPGLSSDLKAMASSLAERDTAVTGWDPNQDDVSRVVAERDRLAQVLITRGYQPDNAMREANRIVEANLGDDRNDVNAGWIRTLRQALGTVR